MKQKSQQNTPESVVATRKTLVQRKKRVRHLMPDLVRQIPGLFDVTRGDYDRVAEDLGVPRADVLAVTLMDTRRLLIQRAQMGHEPGITPIRRSA